MISVSIYTRVFLVGFGGARDSNPLGHPWTPDLNIIYVLRVPGPHMKKYVTLPSTTIPCIT